MHRVRPQAQLVDVWQRGFSCRRSRRPLHSKRPSYHNDSGPPRGFAGVSTSGPSKECGRRLVSLGLQLTGGHTTRLTHS
ncbi:hypothetical protein LshimejAT787_1700160 [Lyophyllum shimeji]|uniref:Uncharacterized protein n=1 Tax=Lyophyllum shimeji TaxID=47721 RepID=A0A9P3PZD3_LYOSH|nr:hypothetical protein LshimejAT787_1700160 [Lyophyllum shimeji]